MQDWIECKNILENKSVKFNHCVHKAFFFKLVKTSYKIAPKW